MPAPKRKSTRSTVLADRARAMRRAPTLSEQILWRAIAGKSLGAAFRRQVPLLDRYVADFVAPAERLVIEVDGGWHNHHRQADARRDKLLRQAGYRVLRLEAELVEKQLPLALARIRQALALRQG